MTSRNTRSSNIPIPRRASVSSPTRNVDIESALSMSFAVGGAGARPRLASASGSASRPTPIEEHRRVRQTARSLTQSHMRRPSQRFEPRIIRADTTVAADVACLSPTGAPTSPARPRRSSEVGVRASSNQRSSKAATTPVAPNIPIAFPRPAYLEHSALRRLLQTDTPSASKVPPQPRFFSTDSLSNLYMAARAVSPSESEDDDSIIPPRELAPSSVESFTPPSSPSPSLRLPTRWSEQVRHHFLSISADGRELTYHGKSSSPSSSGEKEAAAARTITPVPVACGIYYYEVEIVSKGANGHISIGFAGPDVRLSRLPGWERNSWGYHGDDGFSFAAEKAGTPYGPQFGTGDIIGCGIDFTINRAFYTKNGIFLGYVFDAVGTDPGKTANTTPTTILELYPSVGLRHSGEAVRANFGQAPFRFDIDYHVSGQKELVWNKIMNGSLGVQPGGHVDPDILRRLKGESSLEKMKEDMKRRKEAKESGKRIASSEGTLEDGLKGPIEELVLEYLSHHGYAKTARAFSAQQERKSSGSLPVPPPALPSTHVDYDMAMDTDVDAPEPLTASSHTDPEGDIELRIRLVNCVASGDIDTALRDVEKHHPAVLARDGGLMLFKLRCRKFVELMLEAAKMRGQIRGSGRASSVSSFGSRSFGRSPSLGRSPSMRRGFDVDGMDVDVDEEIEEIEEGDEPSASTNDALPVPMRSKRSSSPSTTLQPPTLGVTPRALSPNPTSTQLYEMALERAIAYGQSLDAEYKHDTRPEVHELFRRTFSIVTHKNPIEAPPDSVVGEVVGKAARAKLAGELNKAILRSQGRLATPALERVYRQTGACIMQLGLCGVGAAVFADIEKEFLDHRM